MYGSGNICKAKIEYNHDLHLARDYNNYLNIII